MKNFSMFNLIIYLILFLTYGIQSCYSDDTIRYQYDDNKNRLSVQNEPVIADSLAITSFMPCYGMPGTEVIIFGKKFLPDTGNTVKFNGTEATVIKAMPTMILVTVPEGATTGPISVQNSNGTVSSKEEFEVKGVQILNIEPKVVNINEGEQYQFSPVVVGADSANIKWYVNNVQGGAPATGTISATGLYTAPQVNDEFILEVEVSAQITVSPGFFLTDKADVYIINKNALPFTESNAVSFRKVDNKVEASVTSYRKIDNKIEAPVVSYRKVSSIIEAPIISFRKN